MRTMNPVHDSTCSVAACADIIGSKWTAVIVHDLSEGARRFSELERACPGSLVTGMDLFADGLAYARTRTSCPLVQADVERPPFSTRFDLVGLFEPIGARV